MDTPNNIQDELRSLDSSLPVNNNPTTPFGVPEGYFDTLAERMLAHVKEQRESAADELQGLSPLLAGLSKKTPYSVPDGYFDENAALPPFFLSREASPVLAAIGKKMPYTVPAGYFDNLPEQVMAGVVIRPKAKVVPFFSRTWARVAVAATITGIVFIGGYRLLNNNPETGLAATTQRSADSSGPLATETGGVLQYIQNLSTEDLDEFINTVPANTEKEQQAALAPTEKKEIREWLKNVPENEIDAFLNDFPVADENLLVID